MDLNLIISLDKFLLHLIIFTCLNYKVVNTTLIDIKQNILNLFLSREIYLIYLKIKDKIKLFNNIHTKNDCDLFYELFGMYINHYSSIKLF